MVMCLNAFLVSGKVYGVVEDFPFFCRTLGSDGFNGLTINRSLNSGTGYTAQIVDLKQQGQPFEVQLTIEGNTARIQGFETFPLASRHIQVEFSTEHGEGFKREGFSLGTGPVVYSGEDRPIYCDGQGMR